MAELLTLTRAARLVGVTRGALQKKIKDGDLPTFEGHVRPEDLLRTYPGTRLENNANLERMAYLKDNAFSMRVRERILPDPEVLAARLNILGKELTAARSALNHIRNTVERLSDKLGLLADTGGDSMGAGIASLRMWLQQELANHAHANGPEQISIQSSFLRIMAAQVRIQPSGREFFVDGSDTILEAALRAGLALSYGCSNGNCGLCKAKIVSGEIKKTRHFDFCLSEAEKGMGYALLCSHTAVTDLVIEAPEAGGAHDIPLQHIVPRVKALQRLNDDTILLHLQTPRTNRLRFLAGQYATLKLPDGRAADYPIASCPCDDRNLQFHVRRRAGDAFAEAVGTDMKLGDAITLDGPKGSFTLQENSTRSLLFIACDTGFAPIKSLIEHAMALDMADAMHLYWLAAAPATHYLHNLCRSWDDALDNFSYTPLGFDAAEIWRIAKDQPQLRDFDVYVAGPRAQTDAVKEMLLAQELPPEQLFISYDC